MAEYNSQYTGSQIDAALKIIIDSGVSVNDLLKIILQQNGTGVAEKALVLDNSKNIGGIGELSASQIASQLLLLNDLTEDPSATPAAGKVFVYLKGGILYTKNAQNVVAQVTGGGKGFEQSFTNETVVTVNHQLDDKYPLVQTISGDQLIEGQIEYIDGENLTVTFNSPRTGVVKCVTF